MPLRIRRFIFLSWIRGSPLQTCLKGMSLVNADELRNTRILPFRQRIPTNPDSLLLFWCNSAVIFFAKLSIYVRGLTFLYGDMVVHHQRMLAAEKWSICGLLFVTPPTLKTKDLEWCLLVFSTSVIQRFVFLWSDFATSRIKCTTCIEGWSFPSWQTVVRTLKEYAGVQHHQEI